MKALSGALGKIAKAATTVAKGESTTRALVFVAMTALFEVG
jgi:hypothetical protein